MKIKRILALLLTLVMLITLAPAVFADGASKLAGLFDGKVTYYVDSKYGSDHFDGRTPLTPFKTLEKAFDRKFNPGTTVLFCCGRVYKGGAESVNAYISSSGTESMPITLGSYGKGANPVIMTDNDENILWITGSFINISGLDFTAPKGAGIRIYAMKEADVQGINIDNCRFYDIYNVKMKSSDNDRCAILFGSDHTARAYNCSFTNLEIFDCAHGIEVGGTTFEFGHDNFISVEESYNYNFLFDNIYCHEIWCGGLVLGALRDSTVRNSRFINTARDVPFAVAAIWTHGCDNIMIEYCEIAGSTNVIDGMAIDFDGWSTNCTYRYIYSHDNNRFMRNCLYDAVTRNRGCTVDHCLSVNDNRFPSIAALPLASTGTLKVNKLRVALVMDRFTFTNNTLIDCGPIYFGNLSNANISNNYFGGKSIITGLASVPRSVTSGTCTGTVRNNTFYNYAPLLGLGNRISFKGMSAQAAYAQLFPNGVHTP